VEKCVSFSLLTTRFGIKCVPEFACKFLDYILGFTAINRLYCKSISYTDENKKITFFDAVLKKLDVQMEVLPKDLARMPKNGPLLVVANHPFGGIDGLALGSLLSKIRPDFKLLVNQELGVFKAMKSHIFEVDILSGDSGKSKNLKAMINSSRFLKNGNCLGVFPAGEVSSLNLYSRKIIDPCWSLHPASLARRNNASVLPICFIGNNGWLFQVLGLLHPKLRTLLLARELINKKGQNLKMRIGEPISPQKMRSFKDASDATEYLRVCVEALKNETSPILFSPKFFLGRKTKSFEPLVLPIRKSKLQSEVTSLPESSLLVANKEFEIYVSKSSQAPSVMKEIARLREKTFRKAGEGTGYSFDSDPFDNWYYQIFAWDSKSQKIAGGYRLGVADEIIKQKGKSGMYAASEFSLKRGFYSSLGKSIEVGRSFITDEYQRKFSLLGLIWKAIGEFMNRHPDYFVLYGPVSISADYTNLSRNLLVRFLRTNRWSEEIARRTKAKNPFKLKQLSPALSNWVKKEGRTLDDVSAVISGVEPDGKGVPVLVKHYLKLHGSFVGFGVDPDFNNALDGLIVVDIRNMEDRQLLQYFGESGLVRIKSARVKMDDAVLNSQKTFDRKPTRVSSRRKFGMISM
jgi:putative hemolysin